MADYKKQADAIYRAISLWFEKRTTPLRSRIEQLETEVAELREQVKAKGLVYRGVYEDGQVYHPGEFVTENGSVWACLRITTTAPPGDAWQLAVKKGRNGRDRRE